VDHLLQQGIEGYTVRVTTPEGIQEDRFIEKMNLQDFIQQTAQDKLLIEKIEPRRKDMEAFFLEIVAQ
jgi:ABC-2 type transport system ATP-binding protein